MDSSCFTDGATLRPRYVPLETDPVPDATPKPESATADTATGAPSEKKGNKPNKGNKGGKAKAVYVPEWTRPVSVFQNTISGLLVGRIPSWLRERMAGDRRLPTDSSDAEILAKYGLTIQAKLKSKWSLTFDAAAGAPGLEFRSADEGHPRISFAGTALWNETEDTAIAEGDGVVDADALLLCVASAIVSDVYSALRSEQITSQPFRDAARACTTNPWTTEACLIVLLAGRVPPFCSILLTDRTMSLSTLAVLARTCAIPDATVKVLENQQCYDRTVSIRNIRKAQGNRPASLALEVMNPTGMLSYHIVSASCDVSRGIPRTGGKVDTAIMSNMVAAYTM